MSEIIERITDENNREAVKITETTTTETIISIEEVNGRIENLRELNLAFQKKIDANILEIERLQTYL